MNDALREIVIRAAAALIVAAICGTLRLALRRASLGDGTRSVPATWKRGKPCGSSIYFGGGGRFGGK